MYICRVIPIQLLGCRIEINACLDIKFVFGINDELHDDTKKLFKKFELCS